MNRRIIFFHLLNDYSGSPHILALVIKGLVSRNYQVDLYTSTKRSGFLSGLKGVNYHNVNYDFSDNRFKTIFLFIFAQIISFISVMRYVFKKDVTVYINTIYPFGAALGAAITGKRIIYHVHEIPVKNNIISSFALIVLQNFAHKAIYVSNYLMEKSALSDGKKVLVYNALSPEFTKRAEHFIKTDTKDNILMICSLREFKGVYIFCEIAAILQDYTFTLVLNATDKEINSFFVGTIIPTNLNIFSSSVDVHKFYEKAQLVLNLTLPDKWIETFGLTVLESMTYGIPVIIPEVGGITEIIEDGVHGYKVDSRNRKALISRIHQILSDKQKYFVLSSNAKKRAGFFSYSAMIDGIEQIIRQ